MGQRAFRAFMSLSIAARVLWVFAAFEAFGMLMKLAQ
jgi:hypothetical protein